MITKSDYLKTPEFLLTKYQNEIFRQLNEYMTLNGLSQIDVANKLNVSSSYVSQILNGNFNFTIKKLIELGIMMGKVPDIDFVRFNEYWMRERMGRNPMYVYTAPNSQHEEEEWDAYEDITSINNNEKMTLTIDPQKATTFGQYRSCKS